MTREYPPRRLPIKDSETCIVGDHRAEPAPSALILPAGEYRKDWSDIPRAAEFKRGVAKLTS